MLVCCTCPASWEYERKCCGREGGRQGGKGKRLGFREGQIHATAAAAAAAGAASPRTAARPVVGWWLCAVIGWIRRAGVFDPFARVAHQPAESKLFFHAPNPGIQRQPTTRLLRPHTPAYTSTQPTGTLGRSRVAWAAFLSDASVLFSPINHHHHHRRSRACLSFFLLPSLWKAASNTR